MSRMIAMLMADAQTQEAMRSWAIRSGFDIDDGNPFHVTLLATVNEIDAPNGSTSIKPVSVDAVGFEALGANGEVPVIRVDGDGALQIGREFFVRLYGAEPTFAEFKPHVSITYDWNGSFPVLDQLSLPEFPLSFDRLVVEPFDAGEQKSLVPRRSAYTGAHLLYR